jgi:hypothetical protein
MRKTDSWQMGKRIFLMVLALELADKTLSGGRKPPETRGTQGAYAPRSDSFVR